MKRLLLLSCLLLAACGQSRTSQSNDTPPAEPEAPAEPPAPRRTRNEFDLVASTDGPLHAGQLGQVKITLTGKNGWHVNQEYPVTVTFTAPAALPLTKARLERSDATAFDQTHFEFSAPVTPSAAGNAELTAVVDFAVCTDANCFPHQETLTLPVPVM